MLKAVNVFSGHALCQALVLEGVPKSSERNIESFLRKLWINSGSDFTLDYVKELKKVNEEILVGSVQDYHFAIGGISLRWNHSLHRPKGPFGSIWKLFPDPIARERVLGAIVQSVVYERPSVKQLEKLEDSITSSTRSDDTIPINLGTLYQLERKLKNRLLDKGLEPFGPVDLTNNVLPYDSESYSTRFVKEKLAEAANPSSGVSVCDEEVHYCTSELISHTEEQLRTAPRICKRYWNALLSCAFSKTFTTPNDIERRDSLLYPKKVSPDPYMARDYDCISIYSGKRLCSVCAEWDRHELCDVLGRYDFLQKPGGKLRSVANVNRYVNYTMAPFAEAMEEVFYTYSDSIFVKDQKEGLRRVQSMLREGRELCSLDLSSATDRLDFRVLTRGLRSLGERTPLLTMYSEYFEALAQLPLWSEGLGCYMQFKTGQPLGMKGSFQVLTVMNNYAGQLAQERAHLVGAPAFAVVGDDFVCDARMADQYNQIITSWGGKTNVEKCLRSSEYAEFLSHIVSKTGVFVTKPKYRLSSKALFVNLEKSKTKSYRKLYRLSPEENDAVAMLSKYSVEDMDTRSNLPRLRSRSRDAACDYDLEVISAALGLLSDLRPKPTQDLVISDVAADLLYSERDSSRRDFMPHTVLERPTVTLRLGRSQRLPTTTERYNHHTAKVEQVQSHSAQYNSTMHIAEDIRKLDEALNTSANPTIKIDSSTSVKADEVLLRAMEAVEDSNIPNRSQSARSKITRNTPSEPAEYVPTKTSGLCAAGEVDHSSKSVSQTSRSKKQRGGMSR